MKNKLLIILFFLTSFNLKVSAQELKYIDVDSLKKGEFTSYVSKDGSIFKIGDRVKIGIPSSNKTFAFINMTMGVLAAPQPLTVNFSGTEAEIKSIQIGGSKRMGYQVYFRTKGASSLINYSISVENAIANGEIKSTGKTSDEALSELKKAKDKLDLGLITQEQYATLKTELSKYIK